MNEVSEDITHRLLIVLTPARSGESTIEAALKDCADSGENTEIKLLYVIDAQRNAHLQDCLSDRGFVGLGPSRDIRERSEKHAHATGQARLEEVQSHCQSRGFKCSGHIVTGAFLTAITEEAERLKPDHIYVTQSKLGPLARLFGEKDMKELVRIFGTRLILHEEDGEGH